MSERDKYPHVSLYPVKGKKRGTDAPIDRYRLTYSLPGRSRRTERLGVEKKKAQKRARFVSELIDSIKSKLISVDEVERQLEDARGIGIHITAYESHLKNKNLVPDYIRQTIQRVRTSIEILHATKIAHLTPTAMNRLVEKLRITHRRRGDGKPGDADAPFLSDRSIQHHLTVMKQFTHYLKQSGKVMTDPLSDVSGIKVSVKADRRGISPSEMMILLPAVKSQAIKKWNEMTGPDRRMLYMFAFVTGLRAGELRAAQVSWINQKDSTFNVPGEYTKNGKPAKQPLPKWLMIEYAAWVGDRTGVLFVRMPQSLHRMFQKDIALARKAWIEEKDLDAKEKKMRAESDILKYDTDKGRLVFHSLRHGTASILANSSTPVKVVQGLMRHANIATTMNIYAHVADGAAVSAIDQVMPDLSGQT